MAEAEDIKKNTQDIHALTVNVTRIATIVEASEKRHDSDMEMMKEALRGISQLNERIGATVGMEKDISTMRDTMAEQKGDIRTIRHDLNNALNAITGIGLVNEKLNEATSTIAAQGAKIEALENWRFNADINLKLSDANAAKISVLEAWTVRADATLKLVEPVVAKVSILESWHVKVDGAFGVAKKLGAKFWGFFGTIAGAVGLFLIQNYIQYGNVFGQINGD